MKNGLLIWNVLLTIGLGYLLIAGVGSKKSTQADTTGETGVDKNKTFSIAYFEMDSIEANFTMVKDVKAELTRRESSISAELDKLAKNAQQRYNYFQQQAEAGTMTQEMSEKAGIELKGLEDQIGQRRMKLDQEYSDFAAKQMKDIKNKIEEYLKEYNKDKKFDYIVSYEQGLFYYKDTAYNITADLLKGLNASYKK